MNPQEILESKQLTDQYKNKAVSYEGEVLTITKVERIGNKYWTTLSDGTCINWHPVNNKPTYNESDLVPNPK